MRLHPPLLPCFLLLILLLTACTPSGVSIGTQPTSLPSLVLEDCQLNAPGVSTQIAARCGTLNVAENPDDPSGRRLELYVAVVKAQSANPAPDPLFLLAGGPGESAISAYLAFIPSLDRIAFKHDLVLVDQRGTGQSSPLDCGNDDPSDFTDTRFPEPEEITSTFQECLAGLDADPRYYTTDIFAGDLEAVRQALGYTQIDLLGVSYGTRAALAYIQAYPHNVRAAVLDGMVPPGWHIGQSIRQDAQRSLELIFARCAADPACQAAFPDLSGDLDSLIARLDQSPQAVTLPAPLDGSEVTVTVDGRVAGAMLRLISYSSEYTALIPYLLSTAAAGDLRPLAAQYLIANRTGIESGLFYAVLCSEDMPFLSEIGEQGDFFFYDPLPAFRAACAAYPPAPRPAAEFPSGLQIPVLILSGEADPVTPPANGEALARLLPNSRHIILTGMGHGNFYAGCIPNLAAELFENADPTTLDVSCAGRIAPPPFFLSALGPEP